MPEDPFINRPGLFVEDFLQYPWDKQQVEQKNQETHNSKSGNQQEHQPWFNLAQTERLKNHQKEKNKQANQK